MVTKLRRITSWRWKSRLSEVGDEGFRILEVIQDLGPQTLLDCYGIDTANPDAPLDWAVQAYLAVPGRTP